MPNDRSQFHFVWKASAFVFLSLTLWWQLLQTPLLAVLEATSEFAGSLILGRDGREFIAETESGDWSLRVPIEAKLPSEPPATGLTPIHSIDFDIPRSTALVFTFSLPVFLALMAAAPASRFPWRSLALGALAVLAVEVLLLLLYAEVSAHNIVRQLAGRDGSMAPWPLRFGEHLAMQVLPFATPFLITVAVHRELRARLSGGLLPPVEEAAAAAASAGAVSGKSRRKRHD